MTDYLCPGLLIPQPVAAPPEGYVACYRAGHICPPFTETRTEDDYGVTKRWGCPCCGQHGSTMYTLYEWGEITMPESLRAGLILYPAGDNDD